MWLDRVYIDDNIQEPDKPNDALNYLKTTVGGTGEDKATIGQLRTENSELRNKVRSSNNPTNLLHCLF